MAERLGASRPVVLGDRLDTDILGAHQAGLPSIAVLTGVQTPEDLLNARTAERPTYVIEDLRRLFDEYAAPEVTASEGDGARARVGDRASAVADAGTVTIEAERGSMDGWRAGMSAWWAAHPEEDSATGAEIRWR
ncbi:HAD hydrolase-like protein [Rothia santali]|uniref:HAD hydrolase-like protein n=1 Tax=Rothia santali TaxID=2949643 RepID=UPI00359F6684